MKYFPKAKSEQFNVVIRDCEKDMEFLKQMAKWLRKHYAEDYDNTCKIEEAVKEFSYIIEYLEDFKSCKEELLSGKDG